MPRARKTEGASGDKATRTKAAPKVSAGGKKTASRKPSAGTTAPRARKKTASAEREELANSVAELQATTASLAEEVRRLRE